MFFKQYNYIHIFNPGTVFYPTCMYSYFKNNIDFYEVDEYFTFVHYPLYTIHTFGFWHWCISP